MRYARNFAVCAALALLLAGPAAWADEAGVAGRSILEKNQDSVITVKLVINQRFSMSGMGSQERETRTEATGAIIGADGLTVMSLTSTDPTLMFRSAMSSEGLSSTSELRDVQLLLKDGDEIPAQVVLRDVDLDLAFLRPLKPLEGGFTPIDTSAFGKPEILDEVIALNRLGRVASRVYAASVERIEAIVRKPRLLYVPGQGQSNSALGSPCFTLDGAFVGIGVVRAPTSGASMMGVSSGNDSPIAVLIPGEKIMEIAEQAPAVDESKPVGGDEAAPDAAENDADAAADDAASSEAQEEDPEPASDGGSDA